MGFGRKCSYYGCNKRTKEGGPRLFHFPQNDALREKWLRNCGNKSLKMLPTMELLKRGICWEHFHWSDFVNNINVKEKNGRNKRSYLKKGAIPVPLLRPVSPPSIHRPPNPVTYKGPSARMETVEMAETLGNIDHPDIETSGNHGDPEISGNHSDLETSGYHVDPETSGNYDGPETSECYVDSETSGNKKNDDPSATSNKNQSPQLITVALVQVLNQISQEPCDVNESQTTPKPVSVEVVDVSETPGNCDLGATIMLSRGGSSQPVSMDAKDSKTPYLIPNTMPYLKNKNKEQTAEIRKLKMRINRLEKNYVKACMAKRPTLEDLLIETGSSQPVQDFIKCQITHAPNAAWTPQEKEFALGLYYRSRTAYEWMKKMGFELPGPSTVKRWLNSDLDAV